MSRKFTPEQTLKLVMLYRDHECLWNFSSEEYKDQSLRRTALQEICSDLNIKGFKVDDLKIKIKSIRSTYCIEVNKIEKSLRCGNVYKPRVVWFDLLDSFIRDYTLMKRKHCGMDDENTPRILSFPNAAQPIAGSSSWPEVTDGDEGETSEHNQQKEDTNSDDEQRQNKSSSSESDENEDNASTQEETVKCEELDPLKPTYDMQLKESHRTPKTESTPAYEILVQESRSVPRQAKKRKLYQLDSTTNTVKLVRDGEDDIESILRIQTAPNLRRIAPRPIQQTNPNVTIQSTNENVTTTVDHSYHKAQSEDGSGVKKEDEFDTFGRHVATQLRKLSTLKYLLAQEEIQHIITKLRMDDMA